MVRTKYSDILIAIIHVEPNRENVNAEEPCYEMGIDYSAGKSN